MKYYTWEPFPTDSECRLHRLSGDFILKCARKDLDFLDGRVLEAPLKAWVSCDGEGMVPDHFEVDAIHYASEQVRRIIEEYAPNELQFIPAPVFKRGSKQVLAHGYLLNPLVNVSCIDLDRSPHHLSADTAFGYVFYSNPRLHEERIPEERRVFRLNLSLNLVLREDLVMNLRDSGIIGTDFKTVITE